MKLSVGHKEITAGLVMYLASRGVTGFNPDQVHAEFSFKRGTKELECTLDEESPVAASDPLESVVSKPKATPKPNTETVPVTPATAAVETPAEVVTQAAVEVEAVETVETVEDVAAETAPVTEENLFG